MLKMDQVHVLRHKVLSEGQSIRRVARELGLSRNTVAKYLDKPEPVRGPRRQRARPVWEAVKARLWELVAEWEPRTTAKQRITGMRLAEGLATLRRKRLHQAAFAVRQVHRERSGSPAPRRRSLPMPRRSRPACPGQWRRVKVCCCWPA